MEGVPTNLNTTKQIIEFLKKRGDLEIFVYNIIKSKIIQVTSGNEKSLLEYIIKNLKTIRAETRLKMPMTMPVSRSLVVFVIIFILVYAGIFYVMYLNFEIRVLLLLFTNLGVGIVISVFIWQGVLLLFPKTIGKKEFVGIENVADLYNELYQLNVNRYKRDELKLIHESINEIADFS